MHIPWPAFVSKGETALERCPQGDGELEEGGESRGRNSSPEAVAQIPPCPQAAQQSAPLFRDPGPLCSSVIPGATASRCCSHCLPRVPCSRGAIPLMNTELLSPSPATLGVPCEPPTPVLRQEAALDSFAGGVKGQSPPVKLIFLYKKRACC